MSNHFLIGTLIFTLCLTGCGANQPRHNIDLSPCSITAEPIVGSQDMAILDMSDSRLGIVRVLDGKPFCPKNKCDHRKIIIHPGEHAVIFSYIKSYSVLGPGGMDPVKLTFIAKQGKTYRAIVKTTGIIGWNYNCRIEEESTGQIVAEIEGCDRDEIRWPAMQEVFDAYGGRQKYIESRCYSK